VTRRLYIESTSNERLKALRRLARKRSRNVFVAEGARAVRCALDGGARVLELYAARELFLGDEDLRLVARAEWRGVRIVELGAAAFGTISTLGRTDGIVAVLERPPTSLARLALPLEPLLVVAASIERPSNLGTIVRTACAAGADALLVCDGRTDVFHPEVVRGSVGTIFQIPVAETTAERAVAWLREQGARIVVATPDAARPTGPRATTARLRSSSATSATASTTCGSTKPTRRSRSRCAARPIASTSRSQPASSSSRRRADA